MAIKNNSFITIQSFMVTELELKGNELLIYAIIHGFSQTENQFFTGSLQYLADWTRSSKQGVLKSLKGLIDRNLIVKKEVFKNNVKYCEYATKFNGMQLSSIGYATEFNSRYATEFNWGMQLSSHNNISLDNISLDNIDNNIKSVGSCEPCASNKTKNISSKKEIEMIICNFTDDEDLKTCINDFIEMRKGIKKPITTKGLELMLKKLNDMTFIVSDQIKILEQSIQNSWNGIFPLKQDKKETQRINPFTEMLKDIRNGNSEEERKPLW